MGIRVYNASFLWTPLGDSQIQENISRTLRAWERTPYESGQRFRGRGADCIGSVFGVVDDLDGRQRAEFPGMPRDTSMHDRASAIATVRELVKRYSPCKKVVARDGYYYVQPGDIVVTGTAGGGPGHVEIVGMKNELWHSLPDSGFHQGGFGFLQDQTLFAIYRIQDKDRWTL